MHSIWIKFYGFVPLHAKGLIYMCAYNVAIQQCNLFTQLHACSQVLMYKIIWSCSGLLVSILVFYIISVYTVYSTMW